MACPGENMGAALIQGGFSIATTAMRITADAIIAKENRDLQRELQADRQKHDRELQQFSFDFQERQLDKQLETQERIADKHISSQEQIAAANAWRNYLYSKGIQPFERGHYLEQCTNVSRERGDLIILMDTKVYQQADHLKKVLPYNPMAIVFQEFKRVNQQTGKYANLYDLPFGFGSESAVRQFCRNEFYDQPAIIVYSGFSGSYFFMNAFCNGIFAHQIYIDVENEGKICVHPLNSDIVSLSELRIKRMQLVAENDGVLEAIASCIISAYVQSMVDTHILVFDKVKNYHPQTKNVFERNITELKSFFDEKGPGEFKKIADLLTKVIETAQKNQHDISNLSSSTAIQEIKKNYIV